MKKILLLFAALLFSFSCYCQEISKIGADLKEEMQLKNADELIKITIIMKDQYDQNELRTKADLYRSKADKRSFVVNELKRFAVETQQEVMSYLDFFATNNTVKEITQFWIFNGITCNATKEAVEQLAFLDDVLMIDFDKDYNWFFEDENQTITDEGTRELTWNVLKVNANQVWELGYTGEGIIVAVIDTGVNYNHYDLRDHMWEDPDFPYHGWNYVSNSNNPMDDHNHGTHCAGTVAGDGTAGSQTGMAPQALIMALKVWNSSGSGSATQMCSGFQFAVEHGAHVTSMSGGVPYSIVTEADKIALRNTMVNVLEAGVVASIAAGNEGPGGSYPVSPPNSVRVPGSCPPPWLHPDQTTTGGITAVVCIGATDNNDNIAGFSSRGPVTWQSIPGFNDYPYNPGMGLIRPDVCAPGVNIKSCSRTNIQGYMNMDGTSMATPCVAGVMALMLSKNQELTPEEICEILETTAVHLPTSTSPKGNIYGSGRIDALTAVNEVVVGPISIYEVLVDDSNGNNNGNANPGETIKLDLTLINDSELPVNNVSLTISSSSDYVTITSDYAEFGNFAAGEIKKIEGAFTFELSSEVPAKHKLAFNALINTDADDFPNKFNILAFDYQLGLNKTSIDDTEGNGNSILDPGETADLVVKIDNTGNEPAKGLTGFLTTVSSEITINSNRQDYGDIAPDANSFAPFSVTLDAAAVPGNISIPFNLLVTNEEGRKSTFNFVYKDKCTVKFDLHDNYGDGWNNAILKVNFSDGSPQQNLTFSSGYSATFSFEINSGVTVSLSWQPGGYDYECSFEVYYQGGDQIFAASGNPGSGIFFSWVVNCSGSSVNCAPITGLAVVLNSNMADLTWNAPTSGTPNRYDIYRNYEFVGTTTTTSYSTPLEGIDDVFCVYVVYNDCLIPECVAIELDCIPPSNLAFEMDNDNKIKISWDKPVEDVDLVGYKIYINEEFIEMVTEESYTFTGETGDYDFCVSAFYIIEATECESNTICRVMTILAVPVNLTAIPLTESEIQLEWEYGKEEVAFLVFRDGSLIAENIETTHYIDDYDLSLEVEYCYYVKAVVNEFESPNSNEACTVIVGIKEYSSHLKVYPNPASGELSIEISDMKYEICDIAIYDVFGRKYQLSTLISQTSNLNIDISHLPAGNYVFSISFVDGSTENVKVIIK